jgi:BirA family biotin operon repressor/biotin-[acetyl-CoA-carboxylase] ligase
VLVEGRKVAGVRAETTTRGDAVDYVVLGVGVNLNVTREALRSGLGETAQFATSLREALGRAVDRNAFTARFLTCLEQQLDTYRVRGASAILASSSTDPSSSSASGRRPISRRRGRLSGSPWRSSPS